jgi:hypothetical protein
MASDDVTTLEQDRYVWTGDVVCVTPEISVGGHSVWIGPMCVGFAACVMGVQWCREPEWIAWLAWPLGLVCVAAVAASALFWIRVRRLRTWLANRNLAPDQTCEDLAWRLWHGMLVDTSFRARLNVSRWIERTGPDGPRLITINTPLPQQPISGEVTEEVPMGADREVGPQERKSLILRSLGLLPSIAILAWGLIRRPGNLPVFVYLLYATPLVFSITLWYRLGFRPVTFNRSSAVPGMVRVTRMLGQLEFTRADSVLVLSNMSKGIAATLYRRDGAAWSARFPAGVNDPALAQLIERWCLPRHARTAAVSSASKSSQ